MIGIIINNIKELLLRIGSDHVLSGVGLVVTLLSFISLLLAKIMNMFKNTFKRHNARWIVKKKEPNYMLDKQMNSLMIEFIRNAIYPFVLVMCNIGVSGFIIGFKEMTWRGAVVFALPVVIYIVYSYIKVAKITYKGNDILYSNLTILSILRGLAIEIIIEYLFEVKIEIVHIIICVCITIVQIIENEILIKKTGLKRQCECHGYIIFETLKVVAMCAEVIVCVAYMLNGESRILEMSEYICITCICAILWGELLSWNYEQRKEFKKSIFLKDGTVKTTLSGINEGKNDTVEWRDHSYTINIKKKEVCKISYFAHLDLIELRTREITLTDGTNISAYRYRDVSDWNGLCRKRKEGLEVELYPEEDVKMRRDEN